MQPPTIVGLGEILWDMFPSHKQLGGAPANVAYISGQLGNEAYAVSRIGNDVLGRAVVERFGDLALPDTYLQRDPDHPTGTVRVELGSDGQPRFEITESVAWDFLEWSAQLESLARRTDAVCFGSLAQRGVQSRSTVQKFVAATSQSAVRVFDVNLRAPFFSAEVLRTSAAQATIVKLNHEELPIVVELLGGTRGDELSSARWLRESFSLKLVCVTRGSAGSLLVSAGATNEHSGYPVQVVDTVGAGDAFTATLIHHVLRGSDLAIMNDAANRMGAYVAGCPGATPAIDSEVLVLAR